MTDRAAKVAEWLTTKAGSLEGRALERAIETAFPGITCAELSRATDIASELYAADEATDLIERFR